MLLVVDINLAKTNNTTHYPYLLANFYLQKLMIEQDFHHYQQSYSHSDEEYFSLSEAVQQLQKVSDKFFILPWLWPKFLRVNVYNKEMQMFPWHKNCS